MAPPTRPKAVVFDIIETTFRIEALDEPLTALGLPPGLSRRLYAEALRDSMALACVGRFAPFAEIWAGALAMILAEHGLPTAGAEGFGAHLRTLPPYPDSRDCFATLAEGGVRVLALSNGAAANTRALLEAAGMEGLVEAVLATADVGLAKPRPEVYRHALTAARLAPAEAMLVACHPWDVAGAKATGLMGGYVRRGKPYPAVFEAPDVVAESLGEIARAILAMPE